MERRLVRGLEASSSGSGNSSGSNLPNGPSSSTQQREDPYNLLLGRYTAMGFSRQEVAMGLTIVGPDQADNADKIVDACRKFKKLCSMGFRAEHAVGALLMHSGDLDQATNTCLDAAA